jgi:hypothetical protein
MGKYWHVNWTVIGSAEELSHLNWGFTVAPFFNNLRKNDCIGHAHLTTYRVFSMQADWILTHLLTHGAEPFLRSRQLCIHSRTSQHFMVPEGSIPCSQEPSTGPYSEPYQSNPDHLIQSKIQFNIVHPPTSWTLTHMSHKDTQQSTIEASATLDGITLTDPLIRWSPNEWPSVCQKIPMSVEKMLWTSNKPAKWIPCISKINILRQVKSKIVLV